jgi:uncharacterized membrane protein
MYSENDPFLSPSDEDRRAVYESQVAAGGTHDKERETMTPLVPAYDPNGSKPVDEIQADQLHAIGATEPIQEAEVSLVDSSLPKAFEPNHKERPNRRLAASFLSSLHRPIFFSQTLPFLLLVAGTVWYAHRFVTLVLLRHNQFGSFDYDLGIYDQGIWLLGHGRQFLTVRGLRFLGHHWNPAVVLFMPAYLLGAGPGLLNASQAIAVSAGAIPAFFGTKKLTKNSWIGLAIATAYLLHPSTGWLIQELFHPETMAIPFLLAAWAFAEHERWRWYGAAVVCALLWKEDVSLAVAFLGLVIVWRKNRKYALLTFFGSALYFLVATKLVIPSILGRAAFYEELFGSLGNSPVDLARNAVTHPDRFYKVLKEHDAEKYAHSILRPYGYVSLLSPSSLLIGLPQFMVNLLNTLGFIWDPRFHYIAMPVVSATVGASKGIATRPNKWTRFGLVGILLLFSFGVRGQGIGPWSQKYRQGFWALGEQALSPAYRAALKKVPSDPNVATASPYFLTPHLTHRYEAYTFPNPWRTSYWGVKGENPRSGARVDYVVMNEQILGDQDRATYQSAVVLSGEFSEVFRKDQIVVWKRIKKGV